MATTEKKTIDTRELITGTDGCLFFEHEGVMVPMLELANYSVTMNINAVQRNFVGDPTTKSVPVTVSFALSITESHVRDDLIMVPLLDSIRKGKWPVFHFQSKLEKPDGQEERLSLDHVVPSGEFGIQNVTPGEICDRPMNFAINAVPKYISSIAATYM